MKWKTTLVLFVIAAGVFAYLLFVERNRPGTEEATRQAQNVVNFSRDQVNGVVIQNGDDTIDIRRRDDKWRLEIPIKDQADGSVVNNLLLDLENWQKDAAISAKEMEADKNKLADYGLANPKLRLKLIGPDTPPEIFFGKDAALEGKMYVRFGNSKETFLASQSVKKAIDKKPEDFRDRKLTDLIMAQVVRVVLKTSAGEMELQKKGDHWDILKPLHTRADDQKVSDLIAQVTTARIQQFVADDRGDLHPYGLAEPHGSLTLFAQDDKSAGRTDSSRGEQGQTLQIGGPATAGEKEKDQVYVRFSPRGFVYTLPKKIEEILNSKPNDLRDRHLVRIDTKILDRLTIDAPGKGKTVLARKDETWTIASRNDAPANSDEVRRIIDRLQNEQVTKFVEDVGSNLPKYGLDKPQLIVTFSSFASENTAETKAGEQPFASVAFGKMEGNDVYARVGDEPFVVAVRRNLLDRIFADPIQWQDLSIFNFKPEQIHRLSVTTDKESALVRAANNQWNWAKGSGPISQTNLQSLLDSLATLRTVRWIGSTTPAHAFDKPRLVVTFTTSSDDKAIHKLTIGAPTPDGMSFAKVDEREGTFALSNPDLNALKLSLVGQESPSPSPTLTATPSR
ncbi:MAG TPA: DUF4340 domain-containing protein [Candidatus Dormibacteraeota bacterium]|nr:DUF4340 domain-containing protein [Candidatus Dormibacteraeota bacterium]